MSQIFKWNCRTMDYSPTVIKTIIPLHFQAYQIYNVFLLYCSSSLSAYCLARHLLCSELLSFLQRLRLPAGGGTHEAVC